MNDSDGTRPISDPKRPYVQCRFEYDSQTALFLLSFHSRRQKATFLKAVTATITTCERRWGAEDEIFEVTNDRMRPTVNFERSKKFSRHKHGFYNTCRSTNENFRKMEKENKQARNLRSQRKRKRMQTPSSARRFLQRISGTSYGMTFSQ